MSTDDASEVTRLIVPRGEPQIDAVREIFRDYARSLSVDLGFQGFESELKSLPAPYNNPHGGLILAMVGEQVAGCGAFRRLTDVDYPNACEMKRLYVRPAFRRLGLGRWLARELIDRATQSGYSTMLLDTLDEMEAARELYVTLGFVEIPPYYYSPVPGAHYLRVDLGQAVSGY
jgi:putative acetyltransferase